MNIYSAIQSRKHTNGGLRYSIPTLRALREVVMRSFIKLYRSTLKLSVGPSDNFTIRNEGAKGVNVKARRWDTESAVPMVRKSFSLFRVRSYWGGKNISYGAHAYAMYLAYLES